MIRFLLSVLLLLPIEALGQSTTRRVDTLEDLLALNPKSVTEGGKASVVVSGRSSIGDWGPARTARWDANSVESTNTAFVFEASGGRWIFDDRKAGEIDVRWFGGVASTSVLRNQAVGVDSASALQAAYDYAFSNRIGIVRLPDGVMDIGSQVIHRPLVRLKGSGSAYSQGYESGATGLAGASCLRYVSGGTYNMLRFQGSDASGLSAAQTIFTSGDLSYNTNYNHGGSIEGVSFDAGYFGLRGAFIEIDGCFGVKIRDVSYYPYGPIWPLWVWASNVIDVRDVKGLTSYPMAFFYSADCIVTECSIGGGYGPKLWIKGSKNIITDSQFFNTQAQPNSVRPTFTVNASTDTITISDANIGKNWWTGMPLTIDYTGSVTLPGNLETNKVFYLIRIGSDTDFKLQPRRTYNSSGTGGALQSVTMDISSAGSGTFNIGPGPIANILVDQYDQNQFSGIRADQSYGNGIEFWGASENTVVASSFTESGWNAASDQHAAVRMQNGSINNRFVGNLIRNRSDSSHAGYGLIADIGATNNFWIGQITGVTNMFGANPNTWFAMRWDPTNQRMEVYASGWRGIGTMPNGVAGISYDGSGTLTAKSPSSGVVPANIQSLETSETFRVYGAGDSDGQNGVISVYGQGGTLDSPTQLLGGRRAARVLLSAHNGSGYTFSIGEYGLRTAGPVVAGNAPTQFGVFTTPTNSATRLQRLKVYENGATVASPEGISDGTAAPVSVGIELNSTSSSILVSRMTKTQRNALTAQDGMVIYQTDNTPGFRFRSAGAWVNQAGTADP